MKMSPVTQFGQDSSIECKILHVSVRRCLAQLEITLNLLAKVYYDMLHVLDCISNTETILKPIYLHNPSVKLSQTGCHTLLT